MKIGKLREIRLINKLKEAGDLGYLDSELTKSLGWTLNGVRSTGSCLRNQGQVNIIETKAGWYLCYIEDESGDNCNDESESTEEDSES